MNQQDMQALATTWDLNIPEGISEADIIALLTERVSYLLTRDMETFFQIMYRLDIAEGKLTQAFSSIDPPGNIAQLIWQRQLEKARSKKTYLPPTAEEDDLKW